MHIKRIVPGFAAIALACVLSSLAATTTDAATIAETASLTAAAESREGAGDAGRAIRFRLKLDSMFSRLRKKTKASYPQQTDNAISLGLDFLQQNQACTAFEWWKRARVYGRSTIFWPDADAVSGHLRKSFISYGALLGNQSASPLSGDDVANGFLAELESGLRAAATGNDQSAKRAFDQAAKLDPLSSWPHLFSADLALAQGRLDQGRLELIGIVRDAWPHYAGADRVAVEMLDAYAPPACIMVHQPSALAHRLR